MNVHSWFTLGLSTHVVRWEPVTVVKLQGALDEKLIVRAKVQDTQRLKGVLREVDFE